MSWDWIFVRTCSALSLFTLIAAIHSLEAVQEVQAHTVETTTDQTAADQTISVPESGGVTTVRPNTPVVTRQQVQLFRGISNATAGSQQLSMNRIILPPNAKGLRHRHKDAETVIYLLEGELFRRNTAVGSERQTCRSG